MIKKINICLAFPLGAYFGGNVVLEVYRQLMNFVYSLSCISVNTKCKDCTMQKFCRYFHISGHNFARYPGIIVNNEIFNKSRFNKNEEIYFTFYVIGDCEAYIDFIRIFLQDHLHQKLCGEFYTIKSFEVESMDDKSIFLEHVEIKTPIDNCNLKQVYNDMVAFYNDNYHTSFNKIFTEGRIINPMKVTSEFIKFKTKNVKQIGYIGNGKFENEVKIDLGLKLIGLGKYNYIGGGFIED